MHKSFHKKKVCSSDRKECEIWNISNSSRENKYRTKLLMYSNEVCCTAGCSRTHTR